MLRLLNCLKRGKQGGKPQSTIIGLAVLAKSGHCSLLIGCFVVGFEILCGFGESARKMHESMNPSPCKYYSKSELTLS